MSDRTTRESLAISANGRMQNTHMVQAYQEPWRAQVTQETQLPCMARVQPKAQVSQEAQKAQANLAHLFARCVRLYTCGDSMSVSQHEADMLMRSILFTFGFEAEEGLTPAAVSVLAVDNIEEAFRDAKRRLDETVAKTMRLWEEVAATMPPFENIALWDTLDSIRHVPSSYDARFAAHQVPCDIDYQLQNSVPESYLGINYVHEWLTRLLAEAKKLTEYDFEEACATLDRYCPDYRGLLVNVLDILEYAELR